MIIVISAGGFGNRLNSNVPKSLIKVNGKFLLQHLLTQLRFLDYKEIHLYTNRPEYLDEYRLICHSKTNTRIIIDKGGFSTFNILKNNYTDCKSDILFLYGHSPHDSFYYPKITSQKDFICCSSYNDSTKSKIYKPHVDFYVEPPYFISNTFLGNLNFMDWRHFFEFNKGFCKYIFNYSPCEFNFGIDFLLYKKFIIDNYNMLPNIQSS